MEEAACEVLQLANFSICGLGRGTLALSGLGCRVLWLLGLL